jgi:hypothetical protein
MLIVSVPAVAVACELAGEAEGLCAAIGPANPINKINAKKILFARKFICTSTTSD